MCVVAAQWVRALGCNEQTEISSHWIKQLSKTEGDSHETDKALFFLFRVDARKSSSQQHKTTPVRATRAVKWNTKKNPSFFSPHSVFPTAAKAKKRWKQVQVITHSNCYQHVKISCLRRQQRIPAKGKTSNFPQFLFFHSLLVAVMKSTSRTLSTRLRCHSYNSADLQTLCRQKLKNQWKKFECKGKEPTISVITQWNESRRKDKKLLPCSAQAPPSFHAQNKTTIFFMCPIKSLTHSSLTAETYFKQNNFFVLLLTELVGCYWHWKFLIHLERSFFGFRLVNRLSGKGSSGMFNRWKDLGPCLHAFSTQSSQYGLHGWRKMKFETLFYSFYKYILSSMLNTLGPFWPRPMECWMFNLLWKRSYYVHH